jgi:anti-sigma factor ChrR (cupin superfamily)
VSDPRLHDDAALYALGLLGPAETEEFEQRLTADAEAAAVLREYGLAAEAVVASTPAQAAPPRLRDRVLGIADAGEQHVEHGLGAIRTFEGRWRESKYRGITYKRLYVDKAAGLVTMLVKLEPGAVLPAHRHARTEQCLIVEGDLIHEGESFTAGDFTWAEAGSIDPMLTTRHGALLLIVGPPDNEEVPV